MIVEGMIDDTESNILMAKATSTIAFRNLVIHGLSHIILLIAVCCVLPRCESRVIHRQEFLKTLYYEYSNTINVRCSVRGLIVI